MREQRHLLRKARRNASRNFARSSARLLFIGVTGFLGIITLVLWVVPLVQGRIEFSPTVVDIRTIENEGFPDASYLRIMNASVMFVGADVQTRNRGEDISWVSLPVVSPRLRETWREQLESSTHLSASGFRLYAVFSGDQAAELWPDLDFRSRDRVRSASFSELDGMIGDTGPGRQWIYRPLSSDLKVDDLDWEQVRHLRYDLHRNGLGDTLGRVALSIMLLGLCVVSWKRHRAVRHETIPDGTPDPLASHLDGETDDVADLDFD